MMDFPCSDDGSPSEIPTRPMRVKVLYSFDKDNKDNCLARFPNTLQIPAVAIDEKSQVGVIELRQCIQSIVSASPELVSRLSDGDFTIYAYDYSEYDTPLVGQGLLSAVLAGTSPLDGEKNMITGRVCKNIPALFSNGVKETLEVKLRLVPIAKPAQPALVQQIETMRGMSPATSAGFDPNAWSASMRPQVQQNGYFDFGTSIAGRGADMALVDEMLGLGSGTGGVGSGQQMMGGVGMAETPTDPAHGYNPAFSHSAPGSRAGSPMMGSDSGLQNERLRHQSFSATAHGFPDQSRPVSRASARSEVQSSRPRQVSQQPSRQEEQSQEVEVYYNEDVQPRKRAKVMQANWRGKSSFGAKKGDLRVTAATAHSVQMHRPVVKRPGAPGSDLEPPPRAPTPVPHRHPMLPRQRSQPIQSRSLLRQASTVSLQSDCMSDADQCSDATMSSPENDRSPTYTADGTPPDMPSSPPVFPGVNAPQPSSPGLPSLPKRAIDSGYMSEPLLPGGLVDSYDEDNEDRSPDARDLEDAAQYRSRSQQPHTFIKSEGPYPSDLPQIEMNVSMETPGDMSQLPQKMRLNLPPGIPRERNQGPRSLKPSMPRQTSSTSTTGTPYSDDGSSRPGPPESRRGPLALPPVPRQASAPHLSVEASTQQPQRPQPVKRPSAKRAPTEYDGSEAGSPAPSDTESRPRGTKRSGTGAKRRMIIQQRLEAAIATGDMPTYCSHCGAIETPTWRKLYCKIVEGKPSALDEAEGEGETIQVEPLEWDESTQEVCKFRIRKSLKKTKEVETGLRDYETNTVCNPCGLWFTKFRNMRPSDRWHRKPTSRKNQKRRDQDGADQMTDGVEPQSEAFFTDQVGPDDAGNVSDLSHGRQHNDAPADASQKQPASQYRPLRPRANSVQPGVRRRSGGSTMNASQMNSALQRAVQSSPPMPFRGSQDSPIEVEDLTPKPVRRLLFSSPRREGEVKSLGDNGQTTLQAAPRVAPLKTMPSKVEAHVQNVDVSIFEAFTYDTENLAPDAAVEDDLADLFECSPGNVFKTPRKTPSQITPRSKRQLEHLLKTPTPPSRKLRSALLPNPNAANNATLPAAAANDFMTSPSSSRYFLRSTPSRQERTPGRSSQRDGAVTAENSMTPFSRHLAQMLSDANDNAGFGTSPSKGFDFSDLPTFSTPGRGLGDCEWEGLGADFAELDDGQVTQTGAQNESVGEGAGT